MSESDTSFDFYGIGPKINERKAEIQRSENYQKLKSRIEGRQWKIKDAVLIGIGRLGDPRTSAHERKTNLYIFSLFLCVLDLLPNAGNIQLHMEVLALTESEKKFIKQQRINTFNWNGGAHTLPHKLLAETTFLFAPTADPRHIATIISQCSWNNISLASYMGPDLEKLSEDILGMTTISKWDPTRKRDMEENAALLLRDALINYAEASDKISFNLTPALVEYRKKSGVVIYEMAAEGQIDGKCKNETEENRA